MRVRMLVSRSGADGAHDRGAEIDIEDAEALRMIAAGQCEPVREAPVERAVPKRRAEKAVR